MYILLGLLLSLIVLALRLTLSGAELAEKVNNRMSSVNEEEQSNFEQGLNKASKVGIKASKSALKVLIFVIARMRDFILVFGGFFSIITIAIGFIFVVSATSYLVLFTQPDEQGNIILNDSVVASLATTGITSFKSNNNPNVRSTKPEGVSDESWQSADDTGRKIASFASQQIINPPNGKDLKYVLGGNEVGKFDCSSFVCAVIEGSIGKTFANEESDGFDFSVNKRADLDGYLNTTGMKNHVNSKSSCQMGTYPNNSNKLQPGDILLNNSHVGIYVGQRESDGKYIFVHASEPNGKCSSNVECTDRDKDVGFSDWWSGSDSIIIRPSKLLKN